MAKKTLKITFQDPGTNFSIESLVDRTNPMFSEWEIVFNDPMVTKADAWFVVEDFNKNDLVCEVNPANIFYGSAETAQKVDHIEGNEARKVFLAQFAKVYTFHQYLETSHVSAPPFLPWMINSNHGASIWAPSTRDVKWFDQNNALTKNKSISVFCSSQALTPEHEMRIRFTSKLKDYFGDEIDWFGNGINPLPDKWSGLNEYKYTIVLENQKRFNVVTEKLGDAFLGLCYPFYWGAPNIGDIFNRDGLTELNIEDFSGSISTIEHALRNNLSTKKFDNILENKQITLHELNFISRIVKIVNNNFHESNNSIVLKMRDQQSFNSTSEQIYSNFHTQFLRVIDPLDQSLGTNFKEILTSFYVLLRYNKFSRLLNKLVKLYASK